ALRLIGDRKDKSLIPLLEKNIANDKGQLALESLWALNLCGGLTDKVVVETLYHSNPMVRAWTVRLLGDRKTVSRDIAEELRLKPTCEFDPQVISQLASSAKRLPAAVGLPIIERFMYHHFADDPHIPLLMWWAIESKAESS